MSNENPQEPSTDPPEFATSSPPPVLGPLLSILLWLLRVVGFVVIVIAAVAMRLAARQDPAVVLVLSAAIAVGVALIFGTTTIVQLLAADAQQSQPSKALGIVKLVLGAGVAVLPFVGVELNRQHYGLLNATPYGFKAALPYAVMIGVGTLGIGAGLLSLVGRSANWFHRLAVLLLTIGLFGFALPAASPVQHVAELENYGAHRLYVSRDGGMCAVTIDENRRGSISIYRTSPFAPVREIEAASPYDMALAFTPDGKHLAGLIEEKLVIWKTDRDEKILEVKIAEKDPDYINFSISDDGRRLLIVTNRTATVRKFEDGSVLAENELPEETKYATITPNGKYAATIGSAAENESWIRVWKLADGKLHMEMEMRVDAKIQYYSNCLAVSPDSSRLLVLLNGDLALWDLSTKQKLWQTSTAVGEDQNKAFNATFNGDGDRILVGLEGDRIWIVSAKNGEPVERISRLPSWHTNWSPDGKWLLTAELNGKADLWKLKGLAGKP